MQAVQSCVLSSVEDPQQYKDLTSQNHQPRKQNKTHDEFLTKNQSDQSIQSKIGSESREWLVYLLLATWAMMIFMPETVAWRQKKAASKKHRHHASHNSCQAWLWSGIQTSNTINDQNQFSTINNNMNKHQNFLRQKKSRNLPDVGKSGITTVNTVEGSGSVSVNGLVDRDTLRVAIDGVWGDRACLVRILYNVERNAHHRLVHLRHLSLFCLWVGIDQILWSLCCEGSGESNWNRNWLISQEKKQEGVFERRWKFCSSFFIMTRMSLGLYGIIDFYISRNHESSKFLLRFSVTS